MANRQIWKSFRVSSLPSRPALWTGPTTPSTASHTATTRTTSARLQSSNSRKVVNNPRYEQVITFSRVRQCERILFPHFHVSRVSFYILFQYPKPVRNYRKNTTKLTKHWPCFETKNVHKTRSIVLFRIYGILKTKTFLIPETGSKLSRKIGSKFLQNNHFD